MDLSISIVSFNTKDLLKRCLISIFKYTKNLNFEVIVVDNASLDGSVDMIKKGFPQVKLIVNKKNLFFSKANNQALKISRGKYFLILNSDLFFVNNSIKKMLDFLKKNRAVGACEGLELYEDKKIIPTGSKQSTILIDFFELSIVGRQIKRILDSLGIRKNLIDDYRMTESNRRETFEVEVGCDAFLMVKKKILDKIGGYDDKLKLYYTENDLCLRIKKSGFKIIHFASAYVFHKVSASTDKLGWQKSDIYYKDLLYYYRKNGFYYFPFFLYLLLNFEKFILKIIKE